MSNCKYCKAPKGPDSPKHITEGVFITLTELATRDAELIKAAEARGAAGMQEEAAKVSDKMAWCGYAVDISRSIRAIETPDTAAHDADTRKEEHAKVLEEAAKICDDKAVSNMPNFQRTYMALINVAQAIRSLAQDKE